MRAAYYETQGPAREVLKVGTMADPTPGPDELRIRVAASGINPGDIKKRQDAFGYGMPYPRVIPHSDGAGVVDLVGKNVPTDWIGRRVWCYGAQSYRPFGTAAEYVVLPVGQVATLPERLPFAQGACLGIPAITAHRCVHVAGPVAGRTVLVQGGAGAVGVCAVQLARRAGALVIATVRSSPDEAVALQAGANHVLRPVRFDRSCSGVGTGRSASHRRGGVRRKHRHRSRTAGGSGFGGHIRNGRGQSGIPFWPLLFKNIRVDFLGSDDFTPEDKAEAARAVNEALAAGWIGMPIAAQFPLGDRGG